VLNSNLVDLMLLTIELILLILTFVTIALHRKEERGREELIEKMLQTAKIVSRQEYFNLVISSIQESSKEIAGLITGSKPSEEDRELIKKISWELKKASERGVKIRYLLPKSTDRFEVACLYSDSGANIRFHPGLLVSDVRFTIIDGRMLLLGLPSISGKDSPTKEGYILPSEGISGIFMNIFEQHWNESVECEEYIKEVLTDLYKHNQKLSKDKISLELGIPLKILDDVSRKLENS
jgi:hypothetical protein